VIHPFFRFPSIALGFFLAPLLPWWNDSLSSYSFSPLLHRLPRVPNPFHSLCLLASFLVSLLSFLLAFLLRSSHFIPLLLLSFPYPLTLLPLLDLYTQSFCSTLATPRLTAAAGTCFCHNFPPSSIYLIAVIFSLRTRTISSTIKNSEFFTEINNQIYLCCVSFLGNTTFPVKVLVCGNVRTLSCSNSLN
jgi:hypothetical protein